MEKNDNPNNGMRGDDDDRSQAGSDGGDDVFIQAAAIAGDLNNEISTGKYHIVDEGGAVGVRKIDYLVFKLYIYICIYLSHK